MTFVLLELCSFHKNWLLKWCITWCLSLTISLQNSQYSQSNGPNGPTRRKGRHKSRQKLAASKSNSTTTVPVTNGHHQAGHHSQENQAGLLFKGSARKNNTPDDSSMFFNGAIKRLFSSNSIDRIEELSSGGAPPGTATVESLPHTTHIGPKQQQPNKMKYQKQDVRKRESSPSTLKPASVSSSSLSSSLGHQKVHGKGSDKKSKSSPSLQQLNMHQSGPGRPPHPSGSSGTKKHYKKQSPMMNGKRWGLLHVIGLWNLRWVQFLCLPIILALIMSLTLVTNQNQPHVPWLCSLTCIPLVVTSWHGRWVLISSNNICSI